MILVRLMATWIVDWSILRTKNPDQDLSELGSKTNRAGGKWSVSTFARLETGHAQVGWLKLQLRRIGLGSLDSLLSCFNALFSYLADSRFLLGLRLPSCRLWHLLQCCWWRELDSGCLDSVWWCRLLDLLVSLMKSRETPSFNKKIFWRFLRSLVLYWSSKKWTSLYKA